MWRPMSSWRKEQEARFKWSCLWGISSRACVCEAVWVWSFQSLCNRGIGVVSLSVLGCLCSLYSCVQLYTDWSAMRRRNSWLECSARVLSSNTVDNRQLFGPIEEYNSQHNRSKEYPRTIKTQVQTDVITFSPISQDLEALYSFTDPPPKKKKHCCSCLIVEITSTWLPIPFNDSTIHTGLTDANANK